MTFLLFLASVAVLEYLVRGTGQRSGANVKAKSGVIVDGIHSGPVEAEAATSDLLALGQALNAQRTVDTVDGESNEVRDVKAEPFYRR